MAKTYDTSADWREVPTDMLTGNVLAAYTLYKEQQRLAAQAREAFEIEFSALVPLPEGKRYGFGYRFGKLSVAILVGASAKSAPKSKLTGADLATLLGVRAL